MATRYFVSDEAPSPLVVHVQRTDGSPVNLADYDLVEVEGDRLPPGRTTVLDAAAGIVERSFETGFTEAGLLGVRVRMETVAQLGVDPSTDYSGVMTLPVYDPGPDESLPLLVTTDKVEAITGRLASEDDIVQAQNLVSLAIGANVSDPVWTDTLGAQDRFWLEMAVSYQAAQEAAASGAAGDSSGLGIVPIPGVSSFSQGDLSVSFDTGGGVSEELLASLSSTTKLAIRRLSWLGAVRTLHASPFLSERPLPSTWRVVSRGGLPVARPSTTGGS